MTNFNQILNITNSYIEEKMSDKSNLPFEVISYNREKLCQI